MSDPLPKTPSKKSRFGIVGVASNYLLARGFSNRAVDRLIDALDSEDEDTSMGAYMALVRLGSRCAPALLKKATEGVQTAELLRILGDQGDPKLIPELERFRGAPEEAISEAARESIDLLRESKSD